MIVCKLLKSDLHAFSLLQSSNSCDATKSEQIQGFCSGVLILPSQNLS